MRSGADAAIAAKASGMDCADIVAEALWPGSQAGGASLGARILSRHPARAPSRSRSAEGGAPGPYIAYRVTFRDEPGQQLPFERMGRAPVRLAPAVLLTRIGRCLKL